MKIFIIIVTFFLLLLIVKPNINWYIFGGGKYKGIEPTKDFLLLTRVSALILLFITWMVMLPFSNII
ncbi:hypothetical protein SAMN02745227_00306 [Anaerobranca californiensis DSM 14826]|jgi:hypothetical protein|uniref:DUF6199 domain-containing protein n=1 Tax=Anaerobranca californiensis DSM 14826 TaxID=1120989 RepID=A0A1M6KZ15_9FIRM|nr:hypothetical protein [Anaerobranca californiensis]SHJ64207.1 hypothetical protein SAMN02745227_00306 [Anaerobranca californiensis DSM 14826]